MKRSSLTPCERTLADRWPGGCGSSVAAPLPPVTTFRYRDEHRRDDVALLVHELVHVAQYRRLGKARFLRQYLLDLAKARGYSRRLPLEAPAYERQAAARALLTQER